MENYPCKQQTEQGGGEQGMAALFSISKLELLEESAGTKASWMLLVRASPPQLVTSLNRMDEHLKNKSVESHDMSWKQFRT